MHALAPLWDGWQVLGAVSIDNHVTGTPLTETDCEVLNLYASVIGHLYLEKSAAALLRVTQTAVDFLADGVYQIEESGRFRYVNAAACTALGYTREELLARNISAIDASFPPERWRQHWEELGEDCQAIFETRHLRKDGSSYPVEIRVVHFPFQGRVQHFAFARDLSERQQAEEKMRELAQRVVAGEEQERQRLARELHDQVGQNLAVLGLTLGQAKEALPPELHDARERLDDAQGQVQELREHLQRVMYDLRPPMLDDLGIYQALQWYCGRLTARHDLTITVRRRGPARRWPAAVETALFRIAQEALTNIVLHARATVVMVTLTQSAEAIELEIKDNGVGFRRGRRRRATPRGLGIAIMEERALAVGGLVVVDSAPGRGARITVRVPRVHRGKG
jgi:PAS domain S-box-containing protein